MAIKVLNSVSKSRKVDEDGGGGGGGGGDLMINGRPRPAATARGRTVASIFFNMFGRKGEESTAARDLGPKTVSGHIAVDKNSAAGKFLGVFWKAADARKSRRISTSRRVAEKASSELNGVELCKKRILMGMKCRPVNASGKLHYGQDGIILPED